MDILNQAIENKEFIETVDEFMEVMKTIEKDEDLKKLIEERKHLEDKCKDEDEEIFKMLGI